jgi:YrbI family 3-deoxy-D-manno-octulosonate 8-phosphate phosphatase
MIKALVLDVDGVLTDGGIILDSAGRDAKRFHARDGVGIKLAMTAGWKVLFLTARGSVSAKMRAAELGADWAIGISRKDLFLDDWLAEAKIAWEDVAYMGDDLPDLPVLRRVGWPLAVADAAAEVRAVARHVTTLPGGAGAVREVVEWMLEQEGRREEVVEAFATREEGFAVGDRERAGNPSGAAPKKES